MDDATARELIALNNRFYAEHAASFSATRNAPWAGWSRLADTLRERGWDTPKDRQTVLDLACGNLRFERFMADAFPKVALRFEAIDSCTALASGETSPGISFSQLDILATLLDSDRPLELTARACDLTVCFGFMHHIPGGELRLRVADALVDATARNGLIALSFWQFMDDERLAAKALRAGVPFGISPTALDANDRFLGWQDDARPLRYCHHFDEEEIDDLVVRVSPRAREVDRWSADGASGTLNRYLLLQRS